MQKVEGSSPFIRLNQTARISGPFLLPRCARRVGVCRRATSSCYELAVRRDAAARRRDGRPGAKRRAADRAGTPNAFRPSAPVAGPYARAQIPSIWAGAAAPLLRVATQRCHVRGRPSAMPGAAERSSPRAAGRRRSQQDSDTEQSSKIRLYRLYRRKPGAEAPGIGPASWSELSAYRAPVGTRLVASMQRDRPTATSQAARLRRLTSQISLERSRGHGRPRDRRQPRAR